jgi:hypothetical protein
MLRLFVRNLVWRWREWRARRDESRRWYAYVGAVMRRLGGP